MSDIILFILGYFVHTFVFISRYGKRTTQGILNDLRNALGRYYLNNFVDGTKQVNIDFVDDAPNINTLLAQSICHVNDMQVPEGLQPKQECAKFFVEIWQLTCCIIDLSGNRYNQCNLQISVQNVSTVHNLTNIMQASYMFSTQFLPIYLQLKYLLQVFCRQCLIFIYYLTQDAMDLLQGHYMTSVSRDMAVPRKGGLLENYAVGTICYSLEFHFTNKVIAF